MSSRTVVDDLIRNLFADPQHRLATRMSDWLGASRRFVSFATTYRTKIRKKLNTARDAESVLDLQLELETAFLLLNERRFSVAYEPYDRDARSPDFAVSLANGQIFNVEVTRLRRSSRDEHADQIKDVDRLADVIVGKLTQLRPQMSNIVIAQLEVVPDVSAIQTALQRVKLRAEGRDQRVFDRYAFRDPADFVKHYERLSAVLVRSDHTRHPPAVWINPQARSPVPPRVLHLIRTQHADRLI